MVINDAQKPVFVGTRLHCTLLSGVFADRHSCIGTLLVDIVNQTMNEIWSVYSKENYGNCCYHVVDVNGKVYQIVCQLGLRPRLWCMSLQRFPGSFSCIAGRLILRERRGRETRDKEGRGGREGRREGK